MRFGAGPAKSKAITTGRKNRRNGLRQDENGHGLSGNEQVPYGTLQ